MPEIMIQGVPTEVSDESHLLEILREMEEKAIPEVVRESMQNTKRDLKDAVIVMNGAAQGIGQAIATALAYQCPKALILQDIQESRLEQVTRELSTAGGKVIPQVVDVTNEDRMDEAINEIVTKYGKLTHAVSNAAILKSGPLLEFSLEQFNQVMEVNAGGHYNFVRHCVKYMLKSNGGGIIAQVTSKSAFKGSAGNYGYPASKAACHRINEGVVLEHGQRIRINAAAFGNFLYSPLWTDPEKGLFVQYSRNQGGSIFDMFKKYAGQTNDGKFCTYADATKAILCLLSNESSHLQGQTIPCDHGYTLR